MSRLVHNKKYYELVHSFQFWFWSSKEKNFVIFSDSMSSLQSINSFHLDSGCVHGYAVTDRLVVIGDYDIRLKSGMGLVSSNGSTLGLVGRISTDPNTTECDFRISQKFVHYIS